MIVTEREREREAETQEEGEASSMHWEPDVGLDPGSPGSRPGPKAGAKPLSHPGIPRIYFLMPAVCMELGTEMNQTLKQLLRGWPWVGNTEYIRNMYERLWKFSACFIF